MDDWAASAELEIVLQQTFAEYGFLFVGCFFATIVLWETFSPVRTHQARLTTRWAQHFALFAVNIFLSRWGGYALGFVAALEVSANEFGALHLLPLDGPALWLVSLILLDLKDYWLHRLKHRLPWFWQIHRVHHSDLDFDATTMFRSHPFEAIINTLVQVAVVILLGISPATIIIYVTLAYLSGFFGHGNISMPTKVDWMLRLLIVTPNMHRIHHSAASAESDQNFGFLLIIWDRIFKTYQSAPQRPAETMDLGLAEYRSFRELTFRDMLYLPFRTS